MDLSKYVSEFLEEKGISQDYKLTFPIKDILLKDILDEFYQYARQKHTDYILQRTGGLLATEEDIELFIDSIENPPEPGEGLTSAKQSYLDQNIKDK